MAPARIILKAKYDKTTLNLDVKPLEQPSLMESSCQSSTLDNNNLQEQSLYSPLIDSPLPPYRTNENHINQLEPPSLDGENSHDVVFPRLLPSSMNHQENNSSMIDHARGKMIAVHQPDFIVVKDPVTTFRKKAIDG